MCLCLCFVAMNMMVRVQKLTPRACGCPRMKATVMSSILTGMGVVFFTGGGAGAVELLAFWSWMEPSSLGMTWVTTITPPMVVIDVDAMIKVRGHRSSEGKFWKNHKCKQWGRGQQCLSIREEKGICSSWSTLASRCSSDRLTGENDSGLAIILWILPLWHFKNLKELHIQGWPNGGHQKHSFQVYDAGIKYR